jgi:hypothetical protein
MGAQFGTAAAGDAPCEVLHDVERAVARIAAAARRENITHQTREADDRVGVAPRPIALRPGAFHAGKGRWHQRAIPAQAPTTERLREVADFQALQQRERRDSNPRPPA